RLWAGPRARRGRDRWGRAPAGTPAGPPWPGTGLPAGASPPGRARPPAGAGALPPSGPAPARFVPVRRADAAGRTVRERPLADSVTRRTPALLGAWAPSIQHPRTPATAPGVYDMTVH